MFLAKIGSTMTDNHGQCQCPLKTASFRRQPCSRPPEVGTMMDSMKGLLWVNHLNLGTNSMKQHSSGKNWSFMFGIWGNFFGHQTSHDASSFKAAGNCNNLTEVLQKTCQYVAPNLKLLSVICETNEYLLSVWSLFFYVAPCLKLQSVKRQSWFF